MNALQLGALLVLMLGLAIAALVATLGAEITIAAIAAAAALVALVGAEWLAWRLGVAIWGRL